MLEAKGLRKTYGDRLVVDAADLGVGRGEMIGLLGPNGAGKTTTVSMICGLVRPDAGEVRIQGEVMVGDRAAAKSRIGLAPQDLALYDDLSARANLELFGALYGMQGTKLKERCAAVLELVGLADRAGDKPASFSGGIKRRLNIACALVHDPELLILDEPTVGVDPQSRNAIFENLETLKAQGKALIYTTHYMEEAERLCDRILVMDHGRIIANDNLAGLLRHLPASKALEIEVDENVSLEALGALPGVALAQRCDGGVRLAVSDLAADAPRILAWFSENGYRIGGIRSLRPTLEDVFLALTGHQLRDKT
ncbi:Linearmycin resistance ATP-binding protein LnrL [Burkholderiales bacterium]|nr:Linearmycin resistance ATP-binding protein LnrL [Burkholderiales bacterium]